MACLQNAGRRFYAWLLLNGLILRPFFHLLNADTGHLWGCQNKEEGAGNSTGLEVIVAGLGRTGTHSMANALEQLGYRTYGTYETAHYIPDIYRRQLRPEEVAARLRRCGVKAFIAEPHNHLLWSLLPHSHGAKVLLTSRDYDSWRHAVASNTRFGWGFIFNLAFPVSVAVKRLLCDWVPYAPVLPLAEPGTSFAVGSVGALLLEHCVSAKYGHSSMAANYFPDWNSIMVMVDRSFFHDFHEDVRFFVPPDQLLEFDVRHHGWAELTAFLGRPRPPGAAGGLPRVGAGSAHYSSLRLQGHPRAVLLMWSLLAGSVLLNWLAFATVWAALRALFCCGSRAVKRD